MTTSRDPVLAAVSQVRGWLAGILWARVLLQSVGVGLALWLLLTAFSSWRTGSDGPLRAYVPSVLLFAVACASMLVRRRGSVSSLRAALWIEEHESSGFALVTWVEQSFSAASPAVSLQRVVAQSSRVSLAQAHDRLPAFARSQLSGPLLFGLSAAALVWLSVRGYLSPTTDTTVITASSPPQNAQRAVPIGPWRVRVTPPRYAGLPVLSLGDVASLRALSGTRLEMIGRGAVPDSVVVRLLGDSVAHGQSAAVESLADGWRVAVMATAAPLEVRAWRGQFARLLLIDGVADSIPRVVLTTPVRDSVLRRAEGVVPLAATVHDDLGITRASFDVVISSGDGERFTVRSSSLGAQSPAGQRDATLHAFLDMRALQLSPGDVVHVRAIARDAHPAADREVGTSETRSFRIARPSEYDSVAVEPAAPPEVDKSLLSQRMVLMLTERLEQRRPRLSASVMRDESGRLARDQARLRQAVGDAVFQRLTGEAGGEHAHFAGDGHDHGVEAVGGKLALTGVRAQGMPEEGDDAPVIAINKPLLEAYNAMWDAGRALEQAEPRSAIPFMRTALEAIERARAASRLYLRGRPPTVIIDIAKVRMTGKDSAAPSARRVRAPRPARAAAREARLLAAAALTTADALAARDSLAVLRLESLADDPAFADAVLSLLDAFTRGATPNVTEPFLRARRVLGGIARVPVAPWSRGSPP